jgi:hypothetical protein
MKISEKKLWGAALAGVILLSLAVLSLLLLRG